MSETRTYKGFIGAFRYDDDANLIRGKVVNTWDTITFHGETIHDAVASFHESVDDYLEFYTSRGRTSDEPLASS